MNALRKAARSSRWATATSAPRADQASALAGSRTTTRTDSPLANSCVAATDPTLPVAPVIVYIVDSDLLVGVVRSRCPRSSGHPMPTSTVHLLIRPGTPDGLDNE